MSTSETPPEPDSPDDAVIGRATRRSIVVVGSLTLVALAWWMLMPRGTKPVPSGSDEPIAPLRPAKAQALRAPHFTNVQEGSGVDFVHRTGAQGEKLLPETMGGGVAAADLDSDGDADLVFIDGCDFAGPSFSAPPEGTGPLRVFENLGGMKFAPVKDAVDGDAPMYGMGVAAGDYDGDGRVDLFVTGVGEHRLYRNTTGAQGIRLEDVTATSGIDSDGGWSTATGFLDSDRDGDLDLIVAQYVRWSPAIDRVVDFRLDGIGRAYGPPTGFGGTQLRHFRNDDGRFSDTSAEAGIVVTNRSTGGPVAKALGLLFEDPDHDGDLDVFVANDTVPKFLFRNDGSGHFDEIGSSAGIAFDRNGAATGAMGIDSATLASGDTAIAVGNFASEPSSLYLSRGNQLHFSDDALIEGVGAPTRGVLTFGLVFLDADLDGDMDLFQANGHVENQIQRVQPSQSYRQPSQLFVNQQGDQGITHPAFALANSDAVGDLSTPLVGRGAASADLDLDGDVDLVVTQVGGPPALLRNDLVAGGATHWLRVRLEGLKKNTGAIGAVVELVACGRIQRRCVSPTRSYLSQVELAINFGLGACETVDSLTVHWPDGSVQSVPVKGIDRTIVVRPD